MERLHYLQFTRLLLMYTMHKNILGPVLVLGAETNVTWDDLGKLSHIKE